VTQPSVIEVISKVCQEKGADLEILQNQTDPNKAIATHLAQHLGIDDKIIEKSLQYKSVPARFEIMQTKPLVILDGAHNEDKIKFLTLQLLNFLKTKKRFQKTKPKIHLICALTDNKNPGEVFKSIKNIPNYVYATRFTNPFRKVTNPNELKKVFKNNPVSVFLDPQMALKAAMKKAKATDLILVTGSFFLCSDLRKNWISEDWQLENRKNFKNKNARPK
jgi:dihydrofolate synthase/folylpolyglutamate synthase